VTIDPTTRTTTDHQVLTALHLNRGQLCDITGMYPDECGCPEHYADRPTVISIAALERLTHHPLPAYRMKRRDPRWRVEDPRTVRCTHRNDDLCGDCETILTNLLNDLPGVVEDLHLALRKAVRFTPHGFRRGDKETPDESPIPWNPSAAETLGDLNRIMLNGHLLDRHTLLEDLSKTIRRAHRVIDRPKDREFTLCPECREEIPVTSRKLAVQCFATIIEDDPDAPEPDDGEQRAQRTRQCDYAASWEQHQKDILQANEDALLTMSDLVLVLTRAGEPITRDKVNNLIRRHGLPREQIQKAKWKEGKIVTDPQWVYRLRDVRELVAKLAPVEAGQSE